MRVFSWVDDSEKKYMSYFFLKSVSTLKDVLGKLRIDNGVIISGNPILEEVRFYSDLYTSSINYGENDIKI